MKQDGRYRSRLVVREIKRAKTAAGKLEPEDAFSSMPPTEGLKCLVSDMMTEQKDPDGDDLCMAVWDVDIMPELPIGILAWYRRNAALWPVCSIQY